MFYLETHSHYDYTDHFAVRFPGPFPYSQLPVQLEGVGIFLMVWLWCSDKSKLLTDVIMSIIRPVNNTDHLSMSPSLIKHYKNSHLNLGSDFKPLLACA